MLIEQVSHHPPISAYVAEGPRYTVTGELETKTKFWGKSIGLILAGHERLVMEVPPSRSSTSSSGGGGGFGVPPSPADGGAGAGQREVYEWNRFHLSVNDVILGRFWVDGSGDMRVTNVTTGEWRVTGWCWGGEGSVCLGVCHVGQCVAVLMPSMCMDVWQHW
jgi:hypothetical protein